jgi:predicted membrane protein
MSIFGGLFWGVFLLAAGLVIMLKLIFNLHFSAGRLIFGVFILLIGVSLLIGNPGWGVFNINSNNATIFSNGGDTTITTSDNYSTAFGSTTYDVKAQPGGQVKINCAFGSCNVLIPKDAYVSVTTAFGSISLPNGENISFIGNKTYGDDDPNAVHIDISNAFGSVNVSVAD